MNLRMGSQFFSNVEIPVLWGQRAVLQDKKGRLSIIDLGGNVAHIEILADAPAPGVPFRPRVDGVCILKEGTELYTYNAVDKVLTSITLDLPQCEIGETGIRIGGSTFSGNVISGVPVGIAVTPKGIGMGAPLPPGLAKLVV